MAFHLDRCADLKSLIMGRDRTREQTAPRRPDLPEAARHRGGQNTNELCQFKLRQPAPPRNPAFGIAVLTVVRHPIVVPRALDTRDAVAAPAMITIATRGQVPSGQHGLDFDNNQEDIYLSPIRAKYHLLHYGTSSHPAAPPACAERVPFGGGARTTSSSSSPSMLSAAAPATRS